MQLNLYEFEQSAVVRMVYQATYLYVSNARKVLTVVCIRQWPRTLLILNHYDYPSAISLEIH